MAWSFALALRVDRKRPEAQVSFPPPISLRRCPIPAERQILADSTAAPPRQHPPHSLAEYPPRIGATFRRRSGFVRIKSSDGCIPCARRPLRRVIFAVASASRHSQCEKSRGLVREGRQQEA